MPLVETVLFYLAAANLAFVLLTGTQLLIGGMRIRRLKDLPDPGETFDCPLVSIIVPARNEEKNIAAGIRSLLKLDYANYELVAINDRSTDGTGVVLDEIARENPRLKVVHLTELPAGWLGKNHAMYYGAERAAGEWLLYTDADVVLEPTTLRRAVAYAASQGVDHLTLTPKAVMPNWLLESFVVTFSMFFLLFLRPWNAPKKKSKAFVGIGAFNLIRSEVYRAIGTHQTIAMRPDDDIKLGKIVKKHGFSQELIDGTGFVEVPWYGSTRELIVGLEKNAFAALEYNLAAVIGSTFILLVLDVWPFIAMCLPIGLARWLYLAAAFVLLLLTMNSARELQARLWTALARPLAVLLFVYIQWRAVYLTYANNGIRWRDTHYSLAELRANKV
jgi:glycosyltransferase involved in cell wall biosynthesis